MLVLIVEQVQILFIHINNTVDGFRWGVSLVFQPIVRGDELLEGDLVPLHIDLVCIISTLGASSIERPKMYGIRAHKHC